MVSGYNKENVRRLVERKAKMKKEMDEKKIQELVALISVEMALNDLIKLVTSNEMKPCVEVVKDPQGYPCVHIYLANDLIGGNHG